MADEYLDDDDDDDEYDELNLLVVGETSDGKSTLLCELLDTIYYSTRPDELPRRLDMASDEAAGTTEELACYRGITITNNGKTYRLRVYDTPGVGTEKCPIEELMAKIRAQVESGTKFHCIIATSPVTMTTPGSGAQAVRLLLEEGFCGSAQNPTSAWNHVIFVGTKGDTANVAAHGRFERAVVPKFFEQTPTDVHRLSCITQAKVGQVDDDGNASGIDISALLEKMGELPDIDKFFFESHGLTPELLEKIFRKLVSKNGDPKKLARRVEELTAREHQNLVHVPGVQKIKDEENRIKAVLAGSPTEKEKADVEQRREYLYKRCKLRVNGNSTRMTKAQVEEEFIQEGKIKPRPHGRYEGFPTVCPPKGNKDDIVWKGYEIRFGARLPEPPGYKHASKTASAKPSTCPRPPPSLPLSANKQGYGMFKCLRCKQNKHFHVSRKAKKGCLDCSPDGGGAKERAPPRAPKRARLQREADVAAAIDDEDEDTGMDTGGPPLSPMRQGSPLSKASEFQVGQRVSSSAHPDRGTGTVDRVGGAWIHVDFGDRPIACRKSELKIAS